jgi:hypothetical protein
VTRILKKREYWLLGKKKEDLFSQFPRDTKVVVSEDENGVIVGHWVLIPYWHVECFEIYPEHRKKAGVAKGLFRTMFGILHSMRVKTVLTAAVTDEVEKYLKRMHAIELPGKHFVLPTGAK